MMDPSIAARAIDGDRETDVYDDNGGDGVIGTEAEMTFRAPRAGVYRLFVSDAGLTGGMGGYVLTVQEPYAGAPTPVSLKPTPTPIPTEFGEMAVYRSPRFSFTMQYPERYKPQESSNLCPDTVSACLADTTRLQFAYITIFEGEQGQFGQPQTLKEYADNLTFSSDFHLISREDLVTAAGLPAVVFKFDTKNGEGFSKVLITLGQNDGIMLVSYLYADPDLEGLIDYVFSTVSE
jgi:hypothetical protein